MKIIVASRESKLAVIQAEILMDFLKKYNEVSLLTIKTKGDKILDRALDKVGGKGLFVKELEEALLDFRADITVHSLKDVTMEVDPKIPLVGFSKREDPRDALILPIGASEIDFNKPIGTSSKRRMLQLKELYPEAKFKLLRGNVITRLKKLDCGEYGAITLAVSGLKRLNLDDRISKIFTVDEMIPQAGQGILALQARKDFDISLLEGFNDESSGLQAMAERAFARGLNGGCSAPLGAYAEIKDSTLILRGFFADDYGNTYREILEGDREMAEDIGKMMAEKILKKVKNG